MVLSSRRQHDQIIGCNCPDEPPKVLATVTFGLANGVEAGQQRYIPQASMTTPGGNFFPNTVPMTCRRTGAFQITAKIQLANSVALGARGTGNLLITGLPVLTVAMTDEAGKATANLSGLVNIGANQSVNLGYENTGITAQDVTLATLSLGEIWVP
jgi:hypothetical protein